MELDSAGRCGQTGLSSRHYGGGQLDLRAHGGPGHGGLLASLEPGLARPQSVPVSLDGENHQRAENLRPDHQPRQRPDAVRLGQRPVREGHHLRHRRDDDNSGEDAVPAERDSHPGTAGGDGDGVGAESHQDRQLPPGGQEPAGLAGPACRPANEVPHQLHLRPGEDRLAAARRGGG